MFNASEVRYIYVILYYITTKVNIYNLSTAYFLSVKSKTQLLKPWVHFLIPAPVWPREVKSKILLHFWGPPVRQPVKLCLIATRNVTRSVQGQVLPYWALLNRSLIFSFQYRENETLNRPWCQRHYVPTFNLLFCMTLYTLAPNKSWQMWPMMI